MNKINKFIKNKKVLSTGIIFGILSIIGNILCILITNMAHIYDIVHVFPTIFIYMPIIDKMGGLKPSEFIFIPLAVIIDFIIGLIIGFILKKTTKTYDSYKIGLVVAFLIYWILISFQWLPIF